MERLMVSPADLDEARARQAAVFGGPQPVLTGRVADRPILLRAPGPGDLDAIVASCTDPEAERWTAVPHPYQRSDAEFFVDTHAPGRWSRGEGATFAIVDDAEGYLGSIELRIAAHDAQLADVGYLVARPARGRGYAPAALRALCAWGFGALGLARIEWRAYVGNDSSRRAAEKAGFVLEGRCRSALVHRGERRDAWLGAMLPGDAGDRAAL
jgi:RimJ/RimL family protein N-acetyltransferase